MIGRKFAVAAVWAALLFAQQTDPWTPQQVMSTDALAKQLSDKSAPQPLVIHVGFNVLYRARHIAGTPYAGPGSKPEGIEELKKAVANVPKDREIVLYCGCCPWEKCPNIRPAFRALHDMGYEHVKVLMIPTNLAKDWTDRGFPVEGRAAQ